MMPCLPKIQATRFFFKRHHLSAEVANRLSSGAASAISMPIHSRNVRHRLIERRADSGSGERWRSVRVTAAIVKHGDGDGGDRQAW
jgi:hypothetical protein